MPAPVCPRKLNTTDVGKYVLNFKGDSGAFSDGDIRGDSGILVVRPFGFDVQVPGNVGAVDAGGGAFAVAGDNFTVSARAVLWSQADDRDDNGIADGHDDTDPRHRARVIPVVLMSMWN